MDREKLKKSPIIQKMLPAYRLLKERKRRLLRPVYKPSFYRRRDYRLEYWFSLAAMKGEDKELYPELTKMQAREIAERAGVSLPNLLDGPLFADELDINKYGDKFVIKPDWGAGSHGVMVIERIEEGRLYELIQDVTIDPTELEVTLLRRMEASDRGTITQLIVEESIAMDGLRPQEWKLYCFYGEVGLILQLDRNEGDKRGRILSPTGEYLGNLRRDLLAGKDLPEPKNLEGLIEAGKRVSLEIPTGFVRVDLFEKESGEIIFGEVCLIPGGDQYHGRKMDAMLGQLWDEAEVRILSQAHPLIP